MNEYLVNTAHIMFTYIVAVIPNCSLNLREQVLQ